MPRGATRIWWTPRDACASAPHAVPPLSANWARLACAGSQQKPSHAAIELQVTQPSAVGASGRAHPRGTDAGSASCRRARTPGRPSCARACWRQGPVSSRHRLAGLWRAQWQWLAWRSLRHAYPRGCGASLRGRTLRRPSTETSLRRDPCLPFSWWWDRAWPRSSKFPATIRALRAATGAAEVPGA